jgi:RNA-directed DNA polymerase
VKGTASPFDGTLVYWTTRLQHHPLTNGTLGKLLARQQGRCGIGGLSFRDDECIEIDHILPQSLGGTDALTHLMALHRHCHDQRHAAQVVGGIPVKTPTAEELDEEKVLTSSSGGGRAGAILVA